MRLRPGCWRASGFRDTERRLLQPSRSNEPRRPHFPFLVARRGRSGRCRSNALIASAASTRAAVFAFTDQPTNGTCHHERATEILHHHRHFLSERHAAHRPRLRGDRHRRDRALRAARRQGRVLPDRHRRARPQDEADGAEGGALPRARWPTATRRAFARWRRRSTSPTTISSARRSRGTTARRRKSGGAWQRRAQRRHLPQEVRRLVLRARRGVLRREGDHARAGRRARRSAGHAGGMVRGGHLLLPPLRLPGQAARPLRAEPRFHPAARAQERGGELRQGRAGGPLRLAHHARLGHPGARRAGAHHVRVGRRAHQLHHGRRLSRREAARCGATGRPTCT